MAVPWIYAASGSVLEEWAWLTDLLQSSATGVTQHRRLRQEPRVSIGFDCMASGDERRALEFALRRYGASDWDVPLPYDQRALSASASGSTLTLTVGSARFSAGGRALLMAGDRSAWEVVNIDTLSSGSITLSAPVSRTWPAQTSVLPLRTGRIESTAIERFTGDATGIASLRFGLNEQLIDAASLPVTYRGLPVFDMVPDWSSDPQWSSDRITATEDNELGPPSVFDMAGVALDRMEIQYTTTTDAELVALRAGLCALAGRWSPAWVPSWAQDLRLKATVANGATTIDVAGPLLSASLPRNLRDLRIQLANGTVLHRHVTDAAALSASTDRLMLDSAIATGFAVADVAAISFLRLCVQDADTNSLRHFAPGVTTTTITWRGLAHEL